MNIVLAGPFDTQLFCSLTNLELAGAPPGQGGAPVTDLAAGLRRLGIGVTVVTLDPTIEETFRVKADGVTVVYCPLRGPPRYRARTRALDLFELEIRHLTREIKEARSDLVHAHWTYEYAEAAVRSGRPHLVTMHDLGWGCLWQFRDTYRAMRLVMKYRTMPRVRNLTVVAPFMAANARHYGYFGPVAVVPNGVALPPNARSPAQRDLSRPILVTVGNPGRLKNVEGSIKAFRLIRQHLPNSELHLFGPGLDGAYSNGDTAITAHGNIPHSELMAFLADQATVLIHPSRLESFGMIIAEAKARGVPIVAGICAGGTVYVCDDGVSTLVDIERPQEIADAVITLLADKSVYERTAEVSRLDADRRLASSVATNQYVSLYKSILRSAK